MFDLPQSLISSGWSQLLLLSTMTNSHFNPTLEDLVLNLGWEDDFYPKAEDLSF